MELRESIESINEKLLNEYGTEFGKSPKFRVVFSEDQFEKRVMDYTDEGFELLIPEVRLVPKYKQWIKAKYILERLVPAPEDSDLTVKVSYEPLWTFQDNKGNYLPPFFEGCKLIIDNMFMNSGQRQYPKFKDDMSKEKYLANIEKTQSELFGNETDVGDALSYGSGVGFTTSKTIN